MARKGEIVSTVAEALHRKVTRTHLVNMPTADEGVNLRVLRDNPPDITPTNAKRFTRAALMYCRRKIVLDKGKTFQDVRADRLRRLAAATPGLRGLTSQKLNSRLNVTPETTIKWHPELETALGPAASAVISKDLKLTLTLPAGYTTESGRPLTPERAVIAMALGMYAAGVRPEELPTILAGTLQTRIEEPKLDEMVQAGQVDVEGLADVTETWKLRVDPLVPNPTAS